jgi:Flp pilus assembly pilin Flp
MIDIKHLPNIAEYARGFFECLNMQRGQALAEYTLILAFIFMAGVLALGLLGLALDGQIDSFASAFP